MSLSGVSLLGPRLEHFELSEKAGVVEQLEYQHNEINIALLARAQQLGATILESNGDHELHRRVLADPNTYAFMGSEKHIQAVTKAVLAEHADSIPTLDTKRFTDCSSAEIQTYPYVLAQRDSAGGYDKYLMENDQQLERLLRAAKETEFRDNDVLEIFDRRTFIPTPSNHYTSFRTITAPTGDVLAAGLVYSAHTKTETDNHAIVSRDGYKPDDWYEGLWGVHFFTLLSHPDSPFFLNAKKVMSNVSQGGKVIPLAGDNPRPTTSYEQRILADHGIDPEHPQVPEDLAESSYIIGRIIGKITSLTLGQDYMQHRDTGKKIFLECSGGPGLETYRDCWYKGDPNVTFGELQTASLNAGLDSLMKRNSKDAN